MFDVEKFYIDAINGEQFDLQALISYIKSYKNIVLWGAGNSGTQIGDKLKSLGLRITCFWDRRHEELREVSGVKVLPAFTGGFAVEETLVIICITNGSLGDGWQAGELTEKGFRNYMQGVRLYEALICPFKKGDEIIHEICLNNSVCSMCNCKKYIDMIPRNPHSDGREIAIQVATVILTKACSLDCKYCGQRLGEYSKDEQSRFFELDALKRDFDRFMENVDSVGMVSIIGGEPFLHPDVTEFVLHCLKYKHFGALNITTNGICKITEEMLRKLKNPRVKITFSDYSQFLSDKQKELLNKNISLVKSSGINLGVGVPVWAMPGDIERFDYAEEDMSARKAGCDSTRLASAIVDGYFVPCTLAEVTRGLKILDLPDDYVDLTVEDNLRERIYNCLNKPYYETCRYCSRVGGASIPAGEQRGK